MCVRLLIRSYTSHTSLETHYTGDNDQGPRGPSVPDTTHLKPLQNAAAPHELQVR